MNGRELIRYPRNVDSSHPKLSFLLVLGFVCAKLAQLVRTLTSGAPLTYFTDGGGGGSKGLKFWPKGNFFWGL